jgi:cell division septum initiation protein DivIVA
MSEELRASGEGLFTPSRRGYDRAEVEAYVSQLQRQIDDLQARVSNPDAAIRGALARVGEEVTGILQSAHETSDDIIAQGESDADAHRQAAERHAAQVTDAAERQAADVTEAAERHAAQVTDAAESYAAQVTGAAEQRVHDLDLDTDRIWAERERIVADARDLARQLYAIVELADERFPQNPSNHQGSSGPAGSGDTTSAN